MMTPRSRRKYASILAIAALVIAAFRVNFYNPPAAQASTIPHVPGMDYQICDLQSQYLTSPWTYQGLASGSVAYTVAQYEALPGYGAALPPLPSYIAAQPATTTAAVIFAPGSQVANPAYFYPETPILYFFEAGSYGELGLQSVSGDEFIGGSAPGFPEPKFNDAGVAAGINSGNDTYGFSGGTTTLAAAANMGDATITTAANLPAYASAITFSDGVTYGIASTSGTSTTLDSPLSNAQTLGSSVWSNSNPPIATVSAGAAQGASSVTLSASSVPLVQWGQIVIGTDSYQITSVAGTQSGYTVGLAGLDTAVAAGTPVYYAAPAGGVTVDYLDINDDVHITTGTITLGGGWKLEHNNIHDGYNSQPNQGVAIYGGDQSTIEYNCFARMGETGAGGSGTNQVFDYNELYQSGMRPDVNCGCAGGGKWWGTLNADIVDNAFVENGTGGDSSDVWFDNGNSGALVEGNYFYHDAGSSIVNETGYNMKVDNNLFLDDGWGDGTGQPSNSDGAVNINSSGGMNIPGSRFENQILVTGNYFINDWEGVTIWQSDQRSCLGSGEGWPIDSAYCSGGFPITDTTKANTTSGQYFFSHQGDTAHGGTQLAALSASAGSTTIMVSGPEAINDQIGFGNPAAATTSDTTNVTTFAGAGVVHVGSTSGFPTAGQLRVDTSTAGGGGGFTGAILSYTGTTATTFTGVTLVRGSGTLSGAILQVQPYKVTGENCYANDCSVTITPGLASNVSSGAEVSNAGTCPLYATGVALASGPLSPGGASYWDGCQWQSRNISVSSNTFVFQPSVIAASAPPMGASSTTQCTPAKNCGTNFMAFQSGGTAPFYDQTGGNAMLSNSSFTGCPDWDPGCSTDPLKNINADANPPSAPANNGEAPYNNDWSANSYAGPWQWSDVYSYSGCWPLPTDSSTGNTMPSGDCGTLNFSAWQAAWQQDSGSTFKPLAVNLANLSAGQEIYGASQTVTAYEDTQSPNTISSTLNVGGTDLTTANVPSSPHNFSLNTLGYADGLYSVKVSATDSGGNSANDSVAVYISNGDLNGDGAINLSDLAVMGGRWLQTDPSYAHGNITGQSTINLSDLAVMAANWGWSH